mmetsp:Transcript_30212/g.73538  ORF Transcript_30212/g.73538 Transcript_30212/m.73538 type:complete len:97 (-) Transcript_30212:119-409(-)|eukprot:CAMPEP_0114522776 /NCGR_PEP_ID=MMETSP0109-20121206/20926_1 /TAXON_ID=29199 /ORGANISM="Chlorarachnion reptans, Strain CCCM449" /LENGTH=96 /DNA_ID=CAMNT_0001704023 /DNA_START=49 /DNA_END=339 /DNA_ORIENTATION=-
MPRFHAPHLALRRLALGRDTLARQHQRRTFASMHESRKIGNYAMGAGLFLFVAAVYYRSITAVSNNTTDASEIEALQKEIDEERAIQAEMEKEKTK